MSQILRYFLGFILLLATVGLATCQSMVKADPVRDIEDALAVTVNKS